MKLLVIGSTGQTGRHILEQGLRRGHQITAFSRRSQELATVQGLAGVIQGDATHLEDVRRAVQGQDAIIASGASSAMVRALIPAMQEAGVRRLIITSSRSVVATKPRFPIALAWLFFRAAYADLARAEGVLEASDLDWSVVRATMLTNKPYTGRVHIDYEANATGGEMTLTRADYAMTLLDVAENPAMSKKALGVCGAKPALMTKQANAV